MIVQLQIVRSGEVVERMSLLDPSPSTYEIATREMRGLLEEGDELRTVSEDAPLFFPQKVMGTIQHSVTLKAVPPAVVTEEPVNFRSPVDGKKKLNTAIFARHVNSARPSSQNRCRCYLCAADGITAAHGDARG